MENQYNIPENWAKSALRIAKGQAYLPNSPGELSSEGTVYMCAAACIAYAGLDSIAHDKAETLKREIGFFGTKEIGSLGIRMVTSDGLHKCHCFYSVPQPA